MEIVGKWLLMNWVALSGVVGNILAGLALVISLRSLYVSRRTERRAIDAEAVTAWIELFSTGSADWFLAKLNVKNPSRNDIKVKKITIDIPDFRLADYDHALVDDGLGNRILPKQIVVKDHCIGMPLSSRGDLLVQSGETGNGQFLIHHPAYSQRRSTKVNVHYQTMEPVPQWRSITVFLKIRPDF
jgi:hypothetical protein